MSTTKGVNFVIKGSNQATPAMRQFQGQLAGVRQQMAAVAPLQRSWSRGLSDNRRMIQQVGFQMTDFSVQIAGGQSAMLAFVQQGGQMLQFFGPFGAIAAAALTVFGTMAIMIVKSGVALSQITPIFGIFESELNLMVSAIKALFDGLIWIVNILINNLDVLATLGAFYLGRLAMGAILTTNTFRVMAFTIALLGPIEGALAIATWTLTAAMTALRAILMTVLPTAILIGITYLIVQFFNLVKAVGSVGEAFKLLGELAGAVFEDIVNASAHMAVSVGDEIGGISPRVADILNSVIGQFVGTFNATVAIFSNLPAAFRRFGALAINGLLEVVQAGLSKMAGLINPILEAFGSAPIDIDLSAFTVDIPAAVDMVGVAADAFGAALKVDYVGAVVDATREASDAFVNHGSKAASVWEKMQALMGKGYDVRDWFGGSDEKDKGKGGAGDKLKKIKTDAEKLAEELKKIFTDISSSIEESLMGGFKAVIKGTMSLKDYAMSVLDTILDKTIELLMQPIFSSIAGGIAGGIMKFVGLGLPSFAGGGNTGSGARVGGVDGKGGFYAINHPNETIIDHTVSGGNRIGGGGVTTVHLYVHESEGFAATVDARAEDAAVRISTQTVREYDRVVLSDSVNRVTSDPTLKRR